MSLFAQQKKRGDMGRMATKNNWQNLKTFCSTVQISLI
jgi:hypothetical protein